jgi:hypothetical protein
LPPVTSATRPLKSNSFADTELVVICPPPPCRDKPGAIRF